MMVDIEVAIAIFTTSPGSTPRCERMKVRKGTIIMPPPAQQAGEEAGDGAEREQLDDERQVDPRHGQAAQPLPETGPSPRATRRR